MKQKHLILRVKAALGIIIALIVIDDVFAWWIDRRLDGIHEQLTAREHAIMADTDQIRHSLSDASATISSNLLPQATTGDGNVSINEDGRAKALADLESLSQGNSDLTRAFEDIRAFDEKTFGPLESHLLGLIKTDPVGASQLYQGTYHSAATQYVQLLDSLDDQAVRATKTEMGKSDSWQNAQYVSNTVVLILCLWLGSDILRMIYTIKRLTESIQESTLRVNSSVVEIAATGKQQQATANETAATVSEIGATAKEITATAKELGKTAEEVTKMVEETAGVADVGQSGLRRIEDTMRHIKEAGDTIKTKLTVLSEKAGNINQIITTITKVADQTNLLSLNAAIEAEKAGEYGRGFSVVATEIRRLADQTGVAMYDINQTVKEMQSAVSAGVMSMDKFSEEVRSGVQEIQQISSQLNQIIQQVQSLTPRFETVNEGAQVQATGAQQISESLSQLNEAVQQTVDSLRQSNVGIEQLKEVSQRLKDTLEQSKI